MAANKFPDLCKYYLDCLLEDDESTNSIFANGRSIDYVMLGQPELTHRDRSALSSGEKSQLNSIYARLTRGNQRKSWWYGFPTLFQWAESHSGWKGGFLKPLFIVPLEVDIETLAIEVNINAVCLNIDAFKSMGIELEEAQQLASDIGLYDQTNKETTILSISEAFQKRYPQLAWINAARKETFSELKEEDQGIYSQGIIFSKEGSPYTQGLEYELRKLLDASPSSIQSSAMSRLMEPPTIKAEKEKASIEDIVEVVPLNDTQRQAVRESLHNKFTVITGPPGTGKSQVVASIIVNAALKGKRVLFASKNHRAVDVVEERVNELVNRPFLIRLGRKGTDNRNIQQELIQYLNSLLGASGSASLTAAMNSAKTQVENLISKRKSLLSQIEKYRTTRITINSTYKNWQEVAKIIGEVKAEKIFLWAKKASVESNFSFWTLFSKSRKKAFEYVKNLNVLEKIIDLEKLTEELFKTEQNLLVASKDYFKFWVDNTPGRLQPQNLRSVSDYTSVLQQMIGLDDSTPRAIWAKLFRDKDRLMSELAGFLPAWCVVNLSVRGQLPLLGGFFDIVVIDEASQCDIPSAIPLLFRGKQVVIIGDLNQLQHITAMRVGRSLELMGQHGVEDSAFASFEYTTNSLYKLAAGRVESNEVVMLEEHFRSHSDIVSFSNNFWYHGRLNIGTDYRKLNPEPTEGKSSVEWIGTNGDIEQVGGSGATIKEEVNAVVSKVVQIIREERFSGEIGVVTPFRLNANRIREELVKILQDDEWVKTNLVVDTAVRFQGDERDIMIFSPVVSMKMPQGPKFYLSNTPNLFNVAITRARAKLIVIGNKSACGRCGISHIEAFARYVDEIKNRTRPQNKDTRFETPYEAELFKKMKEKGIIAIPQYVVGKYRLDFAIISNALKLNVEVDGKSTHTDYSGERVKKDILRNLYIQKNGWKILRFWNYEVQDNIDYCIRRIQEVLMTS